jgi:hypothetical protein
MNTWGSTMTDDLIERAEAALNGPLLARALLYPLMFELVDALKEAQVMMTVLEGQLAELQGQLELQQSGLGQPPGRTVGDDL